MTVVNYFDVNKYFNLGDIAYACAYEYTHDKNGKSKHQKPVKGMFTAGDTEAKNNEYISKGQTNIRYFVPFKKNGVDLSWSKAVTIYARCYATTQQECIALYNRLIQNSIEWYEQEIKKLEKDLL